MALPGFSDPNAAAASNAGRGLANLGNFLYEQQVNKPAVQAQTAQTQAQTQALQQQTGIKALELPSLQQQAVIATHPGISKNTLESTRPQSTDISTDAATPDSSIGSTTTASDTGAMGANSSGGQPGSISSPTAAIRPPVSGVGPGTGNSAGVPQATDWTKPSTSLAPINSDELSPVALTKPSAPVATGSNSGATSTTPPTGMSTKPSLTPPVSPAASVTTPEKPFDLRQHLGDAIESYPQWKRDQILADLRQPFIDQKVPVPSDAFLAGYYRDQQSAYYPTMAQRIGSGGMVPIKATLGGPGGGSEEYINPAAAQTIGGSDLPEGSYRDVYTGEIKADPNHALPAEAADTQNTLSSISQLRQKIADARAAIGRTKGAATAVVGGGNVVQDVRHGVRTAESAASSITGGNLGTTIPAEDEATLGLFTSGQFLEGVKGLKGIGRMDVPVVQGVKGGILQEGQPVSTWNTYLDTVDKALSAKEKIVTDEFNRQTRGTKTAFPQVDITGQKVNMVKNADGTYSVPPASSSAPAKSSLPVMRTPEEAKQKLAPGTWFQTPEGTPRQLH